jgi:adenylate cyclase
LKRKLTTILFADAQGYSALMASDEAATLDRLKRYRDIMAGLFDRHEGRQVNTWGDAVIAEFASVVEAVRCAVEIQDSLSAENRSLPTPKQMWFRIGINLGDVMVDNDNLYGDGVNVAQRLESLAEPGGIMVSGTVHSLTHKQLALAFDFAGDQEIKNSSDRVAAFRVRMAGRNLPEPSEPSITSFEASPLPSPSAKFARAGTRVDGFWSWLLDQPKRVRFCIGMIIFFFLINLLTSGLLHPWFIYPSVPFGIFAFLSLRGRERRRLRSRDD